MSLSWKHLNITSSIVLLISAATAATRPCSPVCLGGGRRAHSSIITLKLINCNTTTAAIAWRWRRSLYCAATRSVFRLLRLSS